jgi:hypothetical protein
VKFRRWNRGIKDGVQKDFLLFYLLLLWYNLIVMSFKKIFEPIFLFENVCDFIPMIITIPILFIKIEEQSSKRET